MKGLVLYAVTALFLSSCGKAEDNPKDPDSDVKIPISLNVTQQVFVTGNSFDSNDEIGLFVVNNPGNELKLSGNQVDNMKYTFSNGKWLSETTVYWKDKETPADFYCYSPYNYEVSSIEKYPFSIKTDQSSETNFKSSDFLWGKKTGVTPTDSEVAIMAQHLMSKLVVSLRPGDGYSQEELLQANVNICNVNTGAYINLSNGEVIVGDEGTEKILPYKVGEGYEALMIPQKLEDIELIEVSIGDNIHYLTTSVNLESGKIHNCTVTVSKKSSGINVGIEGWETDGVDNGGTAN